ncbi:MAG TPA: diacylglycerol kinase family lipid kinase [Myxococcota bacterium]|nr:diacylglycerol kinase family lipid kinase [Myxococcota bacterium]HRY96412.1 diacylglycerol kinase family lipid kinase [Myxococcota bacterium]HSA21764.1 diacylglycerol kinase family lipid kinase [Myxococcota bacterium]
MKTLAVVNPHSANGATGRQWPELQAALRGALGEFEVRFTACSGNATTLVREALGAGVDRIVAVGGDGTNNEVVNGFFDGDRPIRPEAELGFLPRGTGGDFRKTLAIGTALEACLPVLRAGRARPCDVGRTTFVGPAGEPVQRHFLNITSFGLGGLVDDRVNHSTKAFGGKASFFLGTLKAMLAYQNRHLRLRVDDGFDEPLTVQNVAVANGQYFGGGMWVAPEARIDDGLFDVVIMGDMSKWDLLTQGTRIYKGTHLTLPKVRHLRGRRVEATSDEEVLIDMDGEQPGRLPITLEIVPAAIRVLAPAPEVLKRSEVAP